MRASSTNESNELHIHIRIVYFSGKEKWVGGGFQDRGSAADLWGSSIVLKIGQDNNGKWVWSAYHNNKKEPLLGHL